MSWTPLVVNDRRDRAKRNAQPRKRRVSKLRGCDTKRGGGVKCIIGESEDEETRLHGPPHRGHVGIGAEWVCGNGWCEDGSRNGTNG